MNPVDFASLKDKYMDEMRELMNKTKQIPNPISTQSLETKADEEYENFLKENPKAGILKVEVFAGNRTIPLADTLVIISKTFGDLNKTFYSLRTDESGIIDDIILPAPEKALSESPSNGNPFALYNITSSHPNFKQTEPVQVEIFDGIKSIKSIQLVPYFNQREE